MNHRFVVMVIVLLTVLVLGSPAAFGIVSSEYFVAVNGDDSNPGTLEAPFATLEKARDVISGGSLPTGGVTVFLRGGEYFRSVPFNLIAGNSGQADKPIVYRSYPGEEARLIGGKELNASWFAPVDSTMPAWSRLDASARGQVYVCDLAAHGMSDYGLIRERGFMIIGRTFMELSYNGRIMQLAKWPNSGFALTNGVIDLQTFKYSGDRPSRWVGVSDVWLLGYWRYGWASYYEAVSSIDTTVGSIKMTKKPGNGIVETYQGPRPWMALNLLEELDTAGEYYIDRATGKLYFWPPGDLNSAEMIVSTMGESDEPIINVSYASNIQFRGLTVEVGRYEGIRTTYSDSIVIENCLLRNFGTDAIGVFFGTNHLIRNCRIYGTGQKGIYLTGGDRVNLISANNEVSSCDIYQFSRWGRTYHPAVWVYGVGNKILRNNFHDAPHSAIIAGIDSTEGRRQYANLQWKLGANNNTFDRNRIFGVCAECDDCGAICLGHGWDKGGNVFSNNFIYNIHTSHKSNGVVDHVNGIYFDSALGHQSVIGNIFYDIGGKAFQLQGGRYCLFENNVIAKCIQMYNANAAGVQLILSTTGNDWNFLERLRNFNYRINPAWIANYPTIVSIPDNYNDPTYIQAKTTEGSTFKRNIGWANTSGLVEGTYASGGLHAFDYIQFADNILDQDPKFVDEANLNMQLRPDSPAFGIPGFQGIPFSEIGPELALSRPERLAANCQDIVFTMQVPSWVQTVTARLVETGTDLTSRIVLLENGSVSIQVPRSLIQGRGSVEVTVTEPYSGRTAATVSLPVLASDLDCDEKVNLNDLAILCRNWRADGCGDCGGADLTGDGRVNGLDLLEFARLWLGSVTTD